MVPDVVPRIERMRQVLGQTRRQLDNLEPRILDRTLREEYLVAARRCLDEAEEVAETLADLNASLTDRRQALLAAETILAVSNRQIRLLLVRLLDTYGPGVVSFPNVIG